MKTTKSYLLQKKLKLFNELKKNLDFIKCSVTKVVRNGKNIGNFYHLTYKDENQKTQTRYISAKQLKTVKSGIQKMKKIKKIINEISKINIELLKKD